MTCITLEPIPRRVALLTDFGAGAYVGQVRLRLAAMAPATPVVSLTAGLPQFRPDLAAYLLTGLLRGMPPRTLYLCVVDPGVGGDRQVLAARIERDWLLAPDNGLLAPLLRRAYAPSIWCIDWRPRRLSASFHGRDLFAPLAAAALGGRIPGARAVEIGEIVGADWPLESAVVCSVDAYGNLITGLDASSFDKGASLGVGAHEIGYARTFCEVPFGKAFWYCNAFGLVEIAVNQARADRALGAGPGDPVVFR